MTTHQLILFIGLCATVVILGFAYAVWVFIHEDLRDMRRKRDRTRTRTDSDW